ncbi:iron complex transport system ATP-binding protein [Leucobacter luti]|uniref:Iron complex transport system ATP-binding protein n=1 Tax=Leucobacter luti TaxID=340320 RepID=A0A4R6RX18_9MICO|nr:ABC transporter ATP-binding protein [Leucobacter luti]TDP91364.1 iron complex transport system ATP-binding protein [Leucobacter luti]
MSTLTASNITWTKGSRRILDDVTLEAHTGDVLGILGPNGAGKTSLLRILAGLRRPDRGTVLLDGLPISGIPRRRLARSVAIVEQSLEVHEDVTVEETAALGRTPYRGTFESLSAEDRETVEHALRITGMLPHRSRSWRTLSGGEQQRTQLARALAQDPEVIILDEPTNHLDIRYQLDMLELLNSEDLTVVTALHDLNLAARFCDRIILLQNGSVSAAGYPQKVITASLINEVYGVAAVVEPSPHTGSPVATYLHVSRRIN